MTVSERGAGMKNLRPGFACSPFTIPPHLRTQLRQFVEDHFHHTGQDVVIPLFHQEVPPGNAVIPGEEDAVDKEYLVHSLEFPVFLPPALAGEHPRRAEGGPLLLVVAAHRSG